MKRIARSCVAHVASTGSKFFPAANSLRARELCLCIAAVLFHGNGVAMAARSATHQPSWYVVTSCDDHGPGTVRDMLAEAVNGDLVDLSQLTCSKITLTTGPLVVYQDVDISGTTTISADGNSGVFRHLGSGTLSLFGITVENGHVIRDNFAGGGGIYSLGNVRAFGITVRNCSVESVPPTWDRVFGGGIFAEGDITLYGSSVTGNSVVATTGDDFAIGGGLYSHGHVVLRNSTVSGNSISGTPPNNASINSAGGLYAHAALISYSSISGNTASFAGGALLGYSNALFDESESTIINSTISGNSASVGAGGIVSSDALLKIWNSTIAFNTASSSPLASCGGVFAYGGDEYLSIRSSIIANNTIGGVAADVCETPYTAQIVGFGNLIIASNKPLPADTLRTDPMLAPLGDYGGSTQTHLLLPGSPAVNAGNNSAYLDGDQRGLARVVDAVTDIGAFEVQPDLIFADGFDAAPQ